MILFSIDETRGVMKLLLILRSFMISILNCELRVFIIFVVHLFYDICLKTHLNHDLQPSKSFIRILWEILSTEMELTQF